MRIAAQVNADKSAHPERYCAKTRCLWRTDETWCPRHKPWAQKTAVRVVQDRR